MSVCIYCDKADDNESVLTCEDCGVKIHIRCLRSGGVPGGLLGDIFFKFTCQMCSTYEREEFIRDKMPWWV